MAPCGHLALLLDRGVLLGQTTSNRRKKVQRIWGLCERGNSPRFENPNSVVYSDTRISGVSVVWLFNPTDVRSMYKAEGSYPSRRSHTALAHLRASQPERSEKNYLKMCRFGEKKVTRYNTGGLLPTNGAEWQRIRGHLQKPLLGSLAASRFLPGRLSPTQN